MKIGVLVSGGDAPGINAAIFSIFKESQLHNLELIGIQNGYDGIFHRNFHKLSNLSPTLALSAGSLLPTGRSNDFRNPQKRKEAVSILRQEKIDALIVIGGNGSLTGAALFHREGFPTVGIPATIDGDVHGTEKTLGFSSALQELLKDIRSVQETASTYKGRIFILEVLGGKCGSLALSAGLAGNADLILIPEVSHSFKDAAIAAAQKLHTTAASLIILLCEGAQDSWQSGEQACCLQYGKEISKLTGVRCRYTITGYGLRGVLPDAFDCLLGKQFGHLAIESILKGYFGTMTNVQNGAPSLCPLKTCIPSSNLFEETSSESHPTEDILKKEIALAHTQELFPTHIS